VTDFGLGPREWSPRWGKDTLENLRREIGMWLKARDLDHGVRIYTQEEWKRRGEKYGNDAVLTMTAEGTFNHIMNYPESRADFKIINDFVALLAKLGFWSEQGYSWTWHLYPMETGPVMGEVETKRPLLTVLGSVAETRPRAVFRQADRYFPLHDLIRQVRKEINRATGAKDALEAPIYSAELDENDDFIIYREEGGKKKVTFVEARSKVPTDPWG